MKYTYALLDFPQKPTPEMPAAIIPKTIEDQLKISLTNLGNQGFEVVSIFPHPQKEGHLLLVAKHAVQPET